MAHNLSDFAQKKTLILLGAGASKGAKIPDNQELSSVIIQKLQEGYGREHLAAMFQFVYSTMQAQKAASDSKDLQSLNFEEVVSTIKLLAERNKLEIRPFLDSWDYRLDFFDRPQREVAEVHAKILQSLIAISKKFVGKSGKQIYSDLDKLANRDLHHMSFWNHSLDDILKSDDFDIDRFVRDAAVKLTEINFNRLSGEGNFSKLYKVIHKLLTELMWLDNADSVEYLKPLINFKPPGEIDIFSLNYDTAIEALTQKYGIPLSDGFSSEDQGTQATFTGTWSNDALRLYKLHGSINWRAKDSHTVTKMIKNSDSIPAIILGTREKLRAEGGFLDILFEFKSRLSAVDNVVAIGYSFGDAHINSYLERWLRLPGNQLTTVAGPKSAIPKTFQRGVVNTSLYAEDFLQVSH